MAKIFSNFLQVNKVEPMDFPKMYEMLKEICILVREETQEYSVKYIIQGLKKVTNF